MKDVSFSCWVDAGDRLCKVACLSLSGSYLECPTGLRVGDICETIISSQDPNFYSPLSLSAEVVRVDQRGVALKFCSTGSEDYTMLQTILLYHTKDPYTIAAEFPTDIDSGDPYCIL